MKEGLRRAPEKDDHNGRYDELVGRLLKDARLQVQRKESMVYKLEDGRTVTQMPTAEIAKAISTIEGSDGDISAGLWEELQWEGLGQADRSVFTGDVTKSGHSALVDRRAEVADKIFKRFEMDSGYESLNDTERKVFLESQFVGLLSELAHTFAGQVSELQAELKKCQGQ